MRFVFLLAAATALALAPEAQERPHRLGPTAALVEPPIPAAPASGARSARGGPVDRFADAVLYAGTVREAHALRGIRTITMEMDSAAVFWRVDPAPNPGVPPFLDCALVDPSEGAFADVFCATLLRFGQDDGEPDDGGFDDYSITYHDRTWAGRPTHAFTVTGPGGGPLDDETASYEMWVDAETLTLVLARSTGRAEAGAEPFTFAYERGDLRRLKGLTIPHHYRTTLYGAAPMFIEGFTDEERAEMALVEEALNAPDLEAAIEALPLAVQETFGFYAAVLGNQPLEVDYRIEAVRFNRPLPAGVFGGFGR